MIRKQHRYFRFFFWLEMLILLLISLSKNNRNWQKIAWKKLWNLHSATPTEMCLKEIQGVSLRKTRDVWFRNQYTFYLYISTKKYFKCVQSISESWFQLSEEKTSLLSIKYGIKSTDNDITESDINSCNRWNVRNLLHLSGQLRRKEQIKTWLKSLSPVIHQNFDMIIAKACNEKDTRGGLMPSNGFSVLRIWIQQASKISKDTIFCEIKLTVFDFTTVFFCLHIIKLLWPTTVNYQSLSFDRKSCWIF